MLDSFNPLVKVLAMRFTITIVSFFSFIVYSSDKENIKPEFGYGVTAIDCVVNPYPAAIDHKGRKI